MKYFSFYSIQGESKLKVHNPWLLHPKIPGHDINFSYYDQEHSVLNLQKKFNNSI